MGMTSLLLDAAINAPTSSPWTIIVLVIGALGGSAGIVAILTVGAQRKKLGADADLTQVNAGVVVSQAALDQMNAAIQQSQRDAAKALDLATRNDSLEKRVDELEDLIRQFSRNAREHQAWDQSMVIQLRALGGNPTDPPPLFPSGLPA